MFNKFDESCTKFGTAGPLLWGVTEFGLEPPYKFISVELINTTRDLVYIKNTVRRAASKYRDYILHLSFVDGRLIFSPNIAQMC